MQALGITDKISERLVLRPLIGMDKDEIVVISRKIDTFETSVQPYEDCCTVFTPKHPKTKPVLAEIEAEESKLDVEALVARAAENIEIIRIGEK
jgi:thiamine biosynthesis protein ThiI